MEEATAGLVDLAKHSRRIETYNKLECPYCQKFNWVSMGDLSDDTLPEIEACQCYACNKKFWLDAFQKEKFDINFGDFSAEELEEQGLQGNQDIIELAFYEKGREKL